MSGLLAASYSLRTARAADFRRLQQIERLAARLFPEGRVDPDDTLSEPALAEHLRQRWLFCLTADEAGVSDVPVGFVAATPQAEALYLQELSVDPAHGQRGLGTRLLSFCIRRASITGTRQQRFTVVTLTTFADLPWNAPFYRRLGFSACDETALPAYLDKQLRAERRAGLKSRIAMQLPL